jgi:hypothetical protein
MDHTSLCERARRWLSGTRRCKPVFSNNASCREIPDAIGWSSSTGSTVVECKTSVSDFYADQKKHFRWAKEGITHWYKMSRITAKQASEEGYERFPVLMMGDFRFYLCEQGVLTPELVAEKMPDHGLGYVCGRSIRIVIPAPRRKLVDKDSEIRYLRFAIINQKTGYQREYGLEQGDLLR